MAGRVVRHECLSVVDMPAKAKKLFKKKMKLKKYRLREERSQGPLHPWCYTGGYFSLFKRGTLNQVAFGVFGVLARLSGLRVSQSGYHAHPTPRKILPGPARILRMRF